MAQASIPGLFSWTMGGVVVSSIASPLLLPSLPDTPEQTSAAHKLERIEQHAENKAAFVYDQSFPQSQTAYKTELAATCTSATRAGDAAQKVPG